MIDSELVMSKTDSDQTIINSAIFRKYIQHFVIFLKKNSEKTNMIIKS